MRFRAWLLIGVLLMNEGCSAVFLRPVSNDPGVSMARKEAACKDIATLPLADSISTAAGATWFYAGTQRRGFGSGLASETEARNEKIFGITSMIVFAASATYGFFVVGQCAGLHKEQDRQRRQAAALKSGADRPGFPLGVLGFQFGMRAVQAAQTCAASHGSWQAAQDGSGLCKQRASLQSPDVRVDFRLGTVASVALLYEATDGKLKDMNDVVLSSAVKVYGKPQRGPIAWPAQCGADASQCLADGEHPVAAEWNWPSGSVALLATLREERPALELRFTRVDSNAE